MGAHRDACVSQYVIDAIGLMRVCIIHAHTAHVDAADALATEAAGAGPSEKSRDKVDLQKQRVLNVQQSRLGVQPYQVKCSAKTVKVSSCQLAELNRSHNPLVAPPQAVSRVYYPLVQEDFLMGEQGPVSLNWHSTQMDGDGEGAAREEICLLYVGRKQGGKNQGFKKSTAIFASLPISHH